MLAGTYPNLPAMSKASSLSMPGLLCCDGIPTSRRVGMEILETALNFLAFTSSLLQLARHYYEEQHKPGLRCFEQANHSDIPMQD